MTIGISLPLSYLNDTGDSDDAQCLKDAFGRPNDCLEELKANGVDAIELRGFGKASASDSVLAAVNSICDAGLSLTLHRYLPNDAEDPQYNALLSPIRSAIEFIRNQQQETILVVHAHSTKGAGPADLARSTAAALAGLSDVLKTQAPAIRLAFEIQRYHGFESPGTTYEGLIGTEQRVVDHEIGFCWDMGHTQSSVILNRLSVQPPPAFLEKVIHTHIHGLSPDADTHWPIVNSNAHIKSGIRQLTACGYNGTYNLELYPVRWGADISTREGILGSIQRLQGILDENGET